MWNCRQSVLAMKEELRPEFSFRSGNESGGGRRRRRGENRGQCKGKRSSRRDQENQWAFEAPPSAQKRFGPGPRISMQASGNHQCAASNRPDTRQRLTRRLELDKEKNPCRKGRPHTKALPATRPPLEIGAFSARHEISALGAEPASFPHKNALRKTADKPVTHENRCLSC